jgi:hypothetical protein
LRGAGRGTARVSPKRLTVAPGKKNPPAGTGGFD